MDSSSSRCISSPFCWVLQWLDATSLTLLFCTFGTVLWLMLAFVWREASVVFWTDLNADHDIAKRKNSGYMANDLLAVSSLLIILLLFVTVLYCILMDYNAIWALLNLPFLVALEWRMAQHKLSLASSNTAARWWLEKMLHFNIWLKGGLLRNIDFTQNSNDTLLDKNGLMPPTVGVAQTKNMLEVLSSFDSVAVKNIMQPRVYLSVFDADWTFHELLDRISKHGYSRVPVFQNAIDNIVGVLYVKDILPYMNAPASFDWKRLLRTPMFVPENKKINDLLRDFQQKRIHIALVVDEYGGISGLVTMEDIIEEVVG